MKGYEITLSKPKNQSWNELNHFEHFYSIKRPKATALLKVQTLPAKVILEPY